MPGRVWGLGEGVEGVGGVGERRGGGVRRSIILRCSAVANIIVSSKVLTEELELHSSSEVVLSLVRPRCCLLVKVTRRFLVSGVLWAAGVLGSSLIIFRS